MTPTRRGYQSSDASADLDKLAAPFIQAFPAMDKQEQQLALALYRFLALGKPVSITLFAEFIHQPSDRVDQLLRSWPGVFFDDDHHVIGFWGLAIQEMPHRLELDDHSVYAWCAWDTLFIAELLNTEAKVYSTCPATKKNIELTISPTQVEAVNSHDVVVSFLKPNINELKDNMTTRFCHFVYFFSNREAGEQWCAEHPDTFLLSLDEAFTLGKQVNAARYDLILGQKDDLHEYN